MRRFSFLILIFILVSTACSSVQPTPPAPPASPCGDGVCRGPENPVNCPQDCTVEGPQPGDASPDAPNAVPSGAEPAIEPGSDANTYWVTNPSSGARLFTEILDNGEGDGKPKPAIILIPGGSGSSQAFRDAPNKIPTPLLEAGYIVVIFDPDGRGLSVGVEDYDGFIHQDGLAEIIRFSASLPEVDPERIGVISFSYGVTMAAGALARYPDLPVRFLIDMEGPADRNDTGGCDSASTGHLQDVVSCDDEDFWAEHEALTFIAQIGVPYQRFQTAGDHAQPDNVHAILMINAAVEGESMWVRLNDLPPNQIYDPQSPPPMVPDAMDGQFLDLCIEYAFTLLGLP